MGLRRIIPRFSLRTLAVFLLLVTSGMGLWWHWEAWVIRHRWSVDGIISYGSLSSDGALVHVDTLEDLRMVEGRSSEAPPYRGRRYVWDVETGTCMLSRKLAASDVRTYHWPRLSPDKSRKLRYEQYRDHDGNYFLRCEIIDAVTRDRLAVISEGDPDVKSAGFSPNGEAILATDTLGDVLLFRRRRPEWWWGVFWLWEFWLTVAFAGLFVWSVVRDRRALGVRASGE